MRHCHYHHVRPIRYLLPCCPRCLQTVKVQVSSKLLPCSECYPKLDTLEKTWASAAFNRHQLQFPWPYKLPWFTVWPCFICCKFGIGPARISFFGIIWSYLFLSQDDISTSPSVRWIRRDTWDYMSCPEFEACYDIVLFSTFIMNMFLDIVRW